MQMTRKLSSPENIYKEKNIIEILVIKCLRNFFCLHKSVFECLYDHMFDEDPQRNHVISSVKIITAKYLKIRLHPKADSINDLKHNKRIRNVLTKQILFSNQ